MPQDVQRNNNLSISNVEQWKPPTDPIATGDWKPPTEPINKAAEPSTFSKAYEFANRPIVSILSPEARQQGIEASLPTLEDTPLSARLKGFMSGATEGAADYLSAAASPLSLALEGLTGGAIGARGAGLDKVATALETPGKIAAGGMVLHGGHQLLTAPDFASKAAGFTEAALGGAGLSHLTKPKLKVTIPSEMILPERKLPNSDLVTLYRWQAEKGQGVPDWLKNSPEYKKSLNAEGRWFTDDPSTLEFYKKDSDGKGKVVTIQVPKEIAEQARVTKTKSAAKFSRDHKTEYFVSRNLANQAKEEQLIRPDHVAVGEENIKPKVEHQDLEERVYKMATDKFNMGKPLNELEHAVLNRPVPDSKTQLKIDNNALDYFIANQPEFHSAKITDIPELYKLYSEDFPADYKPPQYELMHGGLGIVLPQEIKDWFSKNLEKFSKDEEFQTGLEAVKQGNWKRAQRVMEDRTNTDKKQEFKKKLGLKNLLEDETGAVGKNIRTGKSTIKPNTEQVTGVVDKLTQAIAQAMPKRAEQENMYSMERAKRIAKAEKIVNPGPDGELKNPGLEGFYKQKSALKGELPKVDYEGLKLNQSDVDTLIDSITLSEKLLPFEKIRAKDALLKILDGNQGVPQNSELRLLRQVYGDSFDKIIEMHGGLGGPISRKIVMDVVNAPKAIMASNDISAPLRQGLPLIHKEEWRQAIIPMLKLYANPDNFKASQEAIHERPNYLNGKAVGLKLTNSGEEEAFGSKLAEMYPGVKRSEYAFVGFLNKLRADVFDSIWQNALDAKVELIDKDGKYTKEAYDIARFVNNATGRGDLKHIPLIGSQLDKFLQKNASELNAVLFSPRLIASRLASLNPNYYVQLSSVARKEALKSLLAIAGTSVIMNSLMTALGAKVSYDILSSDFMKSKFGNSRLDPNGAYQQYIVAAARLITGKTENSTTGKITPLGKGVAPTRTSLIFGMGNKYNRSFMENKLSPWVGFVDDIASARTPDKNGLGGTISNNYNADVINKFTPMLMNDLIDIYKDNPDHLPLGIGAAMGMGLQTYSPNTKKGMTLRVH